jgi:hypothetical protein
MCMCLATWYAFIANKDYNCKIVKTTILAQTLMPVTILCSIAHGVQGTEWFAQFGATKMAGRSVVWV